MKYRPYSIIGAFISLVLLGIFVLFQNISLCARLGTHSQKLKSLQEILKERRKNASIAVFQQKENLDSLSILSKNILSWKALPDFIKGIDQKMSLYSLYREDVSYSRKESAGSFSIVQVSLRLNGGYEDFRKFLSDIENSSPMIWVKSVQAFQDKTFLRFFIVLKVFIKALP